MWARKGITAYRIEVLVVESVWHAQSHAITVDGDRVTGAQARCIPAPTEAGSCEVRVFRAEDYLVPALFGKARAELGAPHGEWVTVTYDEALGFPRQVSFDDPDAVDEEWTWRVTDFEALR